MGGKGEGGGATALCALVGLGLVNFGEESVPSLPDVPKCVLGSLTASLLRIPIPIPLPLLPYQTLSL